MKHKMNEPDSKLEFFAHFVMRETKKETGYKFKNSNHNVLLTSYEVVFWRYMLQIVH